LWYSSSMLGPNQLHAQMSQEHSWWTLPASVLTFMVCTHLTHKSIVFIQLIFQDMHCFYHQFIAPLHIQGQCPCTKSVIFDHKQNNQPIYSSLEVHIPQRSGFRTSLISRFNISCINNSWLVAMQISPPPHSTTTSQVTLSSVKLHLSLSMVECYHALRHEELTLSWNGFYLH
jgi:hypothetical protein